MSDTELKNDADDVDQEAAVEQIADLLQQRGEIERRIADIDALRRSADAAWRSEGVASAAFLPLYRQRMMSAFWAAALGVPEEGVEETLLAARWRDVFELCPSREAYVRGVRAAVARVAHDRPQMVGAFIADVCGADGVAMLIEAAAGATWDRHEAAGSKAANVHDAPEGLH